MECSFGFGTLTEEYDISSRSEGRTGIPLGNPVREAFAVGFEEEVAAGQIHFGVACVAQLDPRYAVTVIILEVVSVFNQQLVDNYILRSLCEGGRSRAQQQQQSCQ